MPEKFEDKQIKQNEKEIKAEVKKEEEKVKTYKKYI